LSWVEAKISGAPCEKDKRTMTTRFVAEVMRDDLKGHAPKGMKTLKKRLIENNNKKGRSSSLNDLNPVIELLYSIYRNRNK
jgi:hypothetical protein